MALQMAKNMLHLLLFLHVASMTSSIRHACLCFCICLRPHQISSDQAESSVSDSGLEAVPLKLKTETETDTGSRYLLEAVGYWIHLTAISFCPTPSLFTVPSLPRHSTGPATSTTSNNSFRDWWAWSVRPGCCACLHYHSRYGVCQAVEPPVGLTP